MRLLKPTRAFLNALGWWRLETGSWCRQLCAGNSWRIAFLEEKHPLMSCSPSTEAAQGTGQGTLCLRIYLQYRAPNSEPDPGSQSLAGTSAKDSEPCCSPRSAYKLKKSMIWSEDCLLRQASNWPGENNAGQPFPACWEQERTNFPNPFQKEVELVSAFCSYLAGICITRSSTPAWDFGGGSEHVCKRFFQHPSVRN